MVMALPIEINRGYWKRLKDGSWYLRTPYKVAYGYIYYLQDTEGAPAQEFLVPIRTWHQWARNSLTGEQATTANALRLEQYRETRRKVLANA